MTDKTLTIRRADAADAGALVRLAALDSASPPTGDALLAEIGDELWAALELDSGSAIAETPMSSAAVQISSKRSSTRSSAARIASIAPRLAAHLRRLAASSSCSSVMAIDMEPP